MKFIEVCMSFVCRCFDSGLQTGCFSWWFPVGVLWLKFFRRKKRPGRIPLFFAKRAQRDGLAYHLSRIGGHWCEGFIYLEGRCLNGWMEWKEGWFREDSNTTIQEILVSWYVCWICTRNIHRDHGERERECFFAGRIFQQFSWPQDTRGTLCLSIQFGYDMFWLFAITATRCRSWWSWLSSDGLLLSIQVFERW